MKSCAAACKQRMSGEYNMGLVKTRRLAAMQEQQRAKAGMKPPVMKSGAKKEDDSFRSRNGRKSERKGSR